MTQEGSLSQRGALVAAGINLAVEEEIRTIIEALRVAGVRPILLKGPPLVRWLYGRDARSSSDVDLLVAPAQIGAAEDTLAGLGFAPFLPGRIPGDRPKHAQAWERAASPITADLHQNLIGVGTPPEQTWRVLAERTETILVGGTAVESLAPPARLMHVALHAAQHGPSFSNSQQDLAAALERMPLELWREAVELAQRLDAVPAFDAALALLPSELITRERLGLPERKTVESVLQASSAPHLALGFEWLARTRQQRTKAAFLARKAFPSRAWIRDWAPGLARRGSAGLALAYAWRIGWLLRHVGPGLIAWRRARREVKR